MRPATNRTRQNGTVRCAIYTRKSSEGGREQKFNSRQAQGEACRAFISSQRHEGLVLLRANYDDRGFSGATMERPALQRFLADITAGRVDIVVVYKIDRLTRSLADFAKIVEILDARGYVLCFGNPAVRDDDLDGALDPQLPVVLRQFVLGAVRARADRRPRP
jgi:DNA invertase Pin-like site-specific DNA recombinase